MKEHLNGNPTILTLAIVTGTWENLTMLGEMKIVLFLEKCHPYINGATASAMANIHYLLQTLLCVKSFDKSKS